MQARHVLQAPLPGCVPAALTLHTARVALIVLPAAPVALSVLWSPWREAGEEVAREHEEAGAGVPHESLSRAWSSLRPPAASGSGALPVGTIAGSAAPRPRPRFLIPRGNRPPDA
jgi:hypothetical protein